MSVGEVTMTLRAKIPILLALSNSGLTELPKVRISIPSNTTHESGMLRKTLPEKQLQELQKLCRTKKHKLTRSETTEFGEYLIKLHRAVYDMLESSLVVQSRKCPKE